MYISAGKILTSEVGSTKKKRSLTPDVLKNRSISVSESLEQESLGPGSDVASQKSESASPISTPQTSKRKSMQGRKLRPKSIVDDNDSTPDLVMTSSAMQAVNGSGGSNSEQVDTVPELPSASALTHLAKARPKRPKKHAPTRGTVVSRPNDSENSFDEGMERFYTSSANNSFSPGKEIYL